MKWITTTTSEQNKHKHVTKGKNTNFELRNGIFKDNLETNFRCIGVRLLRKMERMLCDKTNSNGALKRQTAKHIEQPFHLL